MVASKKSKGGRVTPPRSQQPAPSGGPDRRRGPRLGGPNRPIEGPVQAGKRPSNPATLLVIALAWIGCGIFALVFLKAGWKLIPGVVFIGVGLLFLRGAAATVARRGGAD